MPPDEGNLSRLLPKALPAADLVLGLCESAELANLLPEMVLRSGARAMLVPIENHRWVPPPAVEYLRARMEELGGAAAFPKPFCSLTMRTYNEASWRVTYQDAHIEEFARYFGRPELRILFDETQGVTRCQVRRDTACGFCQVLAERLVGCPIDQVETLAVDLLKEHHCPNVMGSDPDYRAPLSQVAESIVREAVRREVAPFLRRDVMDAGDMVPA